MRLRGASRRVGRAPLYFREICAKSARSDARARYRSRIALNTGAISLKLDEHPYVLVPLACRWDALVLLNLLRAHRHLPILGLDASRRCHL